VAKQHDDSWKTKGACHGVNKPEVFFPEIPSGDVRRIHWAAAKQYCDACTVTLQCLNYQLAFEAETGRREGYWGNMTPKERDQHVRVTQPIRWKR
jgi:hypothetical protein